MARIDSRPRAHSSLGDAVAAALGESPLGPHRPQPGSARNPAERHQVAPSWFPGADARDSSDCVGALATGSN